MDWKIIEKYLSRVIQMKEEAKSMNDERPAEDR